MYIEICKYNIYNYNYKYICIKFTEQCKLFLIQGNHKNLFNCTIIVNLLILVFISQYED